MKDYSATIKIEVSFQAANDDQAQERADKLAESYELHFYTPTRKDKFAPAWVGEEQNRTAEDVECQE